MKKIYVIGALACLFTACKPSVNISTAPVQGDADFTNYMSIGGSFTSGFADSSLTVSGQLNSYPQRLFEQFSLVGANGPFIHPLVTGDNGYPWLKKTLGIVYNSCTGDSSLSVVTHAGPIDSVGSYRFYGVINNGQVNNIAVPALRVVDYPVMGYATAVSNLYNLPFASRFYKNPAGTPMDELSTRVKNLHPGFFTLWLGENDVLGYAMAGGQGNGSGGALPLAGNFYNTSDISPYSAFNKNYDTIVYQAIHTGARGALINIPDITAMPFFTSFPANGLYLNRSGEADTLRNQIWGASTWNKVFQPGWNYFIIEDNAYNVRQAVPGELILMSVPKDSITCAGWGRTKPIPARYVLTTDELQHIRNAVTSYNAFIKVKAEQHLLAYVDLNSYMSQLAGGITYNGVTYNTKFMSNGAYSLDGVHLTPRGNALVANRILETINSFYRSTIPFVDVNKYRGINFPN